MKALFLVFHGFEPHNGISKKIGYQITALQQCGMDTRLCYLTIGENGCHKRMIDNEVLEEYGKGIFAKIRKRIQYSKLIEYIIKNDIRLLYIRSFHNANPFLIWMIKKLDQVGVKSVMEIPTYPYDHEYKDISFADGFSLFLDKVFRYKLAKYIYRIITFSDHKMIFGAPTINLSNGIDFNHIKIKTKLNNDPHSLRLIGVAEIHFWHGFDRVLTGLAAYYQKQHNIKVLFDIVGYGDEELKKLEALVIANNLQEYVRFHGPKSGKELDQLFDEADMGIASLARHRSNITHIKPLKNREYAARGIPFVYSEIDDDFENMPYVMKAPTDETPLDIKEIVRFFYKRRFEPLEIRKTIVDKLSWNVQMKKVVDVVVNKIRPITKE
jgi:glycosyltransferase involved in cell wall biosynthesis